MLCESWQRINTSSPGPDVACKCCEAVLQRFWTQRADDFSLRRTGAWNGFHVPPHLHHCWAVSNWLSIPLFLFYFTDTKGKLNPPSKKWSSQQVSMLEWDCKTFFFEKSSIIKKKEKNHNEKGQFRGRINGNLQVYERPPGTCAVPDLSHWSAMASLWSPPLFFSVCNWQVHNNSPSCRLACPQQQPTQSHEILTKATS